MTLQQLNDDRIRNWTRAQKDEWWFRNIYRRDMPQPTIQLAFTGILSATALYIGAKTGISIGVGLTSVILAFAGFRISAKSGFAQDFTILKNNDTQSIATTAGYMITPLTMSMAALYAGDGTDRAL